MKEEKVCMDLMSSVSKIWHEIIEKEIRKEHAKIDRQLVEMATGTKYEKLVEMATETKYETKGVKENAQKKQRQNQKN